MTVVSSSAARCAPAGQVELFGFAAAVDARTRIIPPCRVCGATTAVVGAGVGPHFAKLLCAHGHFQGWLPRPRRAR